MNTAQITDQLTELKEKVSRIGDKYTQSLAAGGPGVTRAAKQIPWICETLDQAAAALATERDPFGNPITPAQVVNGLKQLIGFVCEPSYGTLMEIAYPGIDKPLQECMDELDSIILQI